MIHFETLSVNNMFKHFYKKLFSRGRKNIASEQTIRLTMHGIARCSMKVL
jgi:hypothetical protein